MRCVVTLGLAGGLAVQWDDVEYYICKLEGVTGAGKKIVLD
jgi:hypothetical protein